MFRAIRRHEHELDRWFTQRLGYRLHLGADTARLYRSGYVPSDRPLRTRTERPFHQLDYTMLALVLGCVVAGPAVISLRVLVDDVRSAAAEAGVELANDGPERRSLVTALTWMIDQGMAAELHEHVSAYVDDATSDAVLRIRPERVALLATASLGDAGSAEAVIARAERPTPLRQWMRCRLVEDPVLYRDDLDDDAWAELRRRLGEKRHALDEMFGLHLEARAEGIAAIDPAEALVDRPFPSTGTVGHAALLLIGELSREGSPAVRPWADVVATVTELAGRHRRRWANDLVERPERLTNQVLQLLVGVRLAVLDGDGAGRQVRLLPAAARFLTVERRSDADADAAGSAQGTLL